MCTQDFYERVLLGTRQVRGVRSRIGQMHDLDAAATGLCQFCGNFRTRMTFHIGSILCTGLALDQSIHAGYSGIGDLTLGKMALFI